MAPSFRGFHLTINNPKIPIKNFLEQWLADGLIVFGAGQTEKGANGTVHHQIYIVTKPNEKNKNGFTVKWVKDNIHKTAHIEPKKYGTHKACVDYVTKEETRLDDPQAGPFTVGSWSDTAGQSLGGTRGGAVHAAKVLAIKEKIDNGARDDQLWQEHFSTMLTNSKGFDKYRVAMKAKHRTWQTRVIVLYGPPGTGKSHEAWRRAQAAFGDDIYPLRLNTGDNTWFDGYSGQAGVIIEEFYGNMKINFFLQLADKYPMLVEIKGGMTPFLAKTIIITSNEHPKMWWGKGAEPGAPSKIPIDVINAAMRRLEPPYGVIIEMKTPFVHPQETRTTAEMWDDMGKIADEIDNGSKPPSIDLTQDEADAEAYNDNIDRCPYCENITEHCICLEDIEDDGDDDYTPPLFDDDDVQEHRLASGTGRRNAIAPNVDDDDDEVIVIPTKRSKPTCKIYCDCMYGDLPCDIVMRTDTTTFGIEKVKDKRDGKEPVQSKLVLKRKIKQEDDDQDDK